MAPADDIEIHPATEADGVQFTRSVAAAFGSVATDDDIAFWNLGTEWDRFLAAVDGGQIVGGAGAISMELTLPGASGQPCPIIPVAGVTAVGVLPTHRRRGVQRRLMNTQLADVRQRGECVAVLTASESLIYRRYGYGLATRYERASLATDHAAFLDPVSTQGRVRLVEAAEAGKVLPAVHEQGRRIRAGDVSRPADWWERYFRDRADDREGGTALFFAVHESRHGEPDGYATYRLHHRWDEGQADHQARSSDVYALDAQVHAELWRFLLDLDLVSEVVATALPLDDALRWRLVDPRRLRTQSLGDHLWARIIDVPAALSARGYQTEGTLVFEVLSDDAEVAGRYLLDATPDGVSCRRAHRGESVELAVPLADLGSVYLGGVGLATLAATGRVDERVAGAVARGDVLFRTHSQPWCGSDF